MRMSQKLFVALAITSGFVFGVLGKECRADIDPSTLQTLKTNFAKADKDGDGKLTRDECAAGMPRIYRGFDRIDTDSRGWITLDQIITFVSNR